MAPIIPLIVSMLNSFSANSFDASEIVFRNVMSVIIRSKQFANPSISPDLNNSIFSPSFATSGIHPTGVVITGKPNAHASSTAIGNPSA